MSALHSPGILGFEMEKIYQAENFRMCSECPSLLACKKSQSSPWTEHPFFCKIQIRRQASC